MPLVELQFPVLGETLPTDHGYALYAGLSRLVPTLHADLSAVAISSVLGVFAGEAMLKLDPRLSKVRLRCPAEQVAALLPLASHSLDVAGHRIRLGVPRLYALVPAPSLLARVVTIKGCTEPVPFLAACRRQLDALGVAAEVGLPLLSQGKHEGRPRRHVLRIADKQVVGFSVQVIGLTAEESITVQEHGLGGRRRMGCGYFLPDRPTG